MVSHLLRGALAAVVIVCSCLLIIAAYEAFLRWSIPPLEPRVQGVKGTVERRIHLSIKGEWDTDKRRKFVCREEP